MACVLCQELQNRQMWNAVLSGQAHVLYAMAGIHFLGWLLLLLGAIWVGAALLLISTGVIVDIWAHGFTH